MPQKSKNKQRKILIHRIIAGLVCAAVIFALVFIVKSCVGGKDEPVLKATEEPAEPTIPVRSSTAVDGEYYRNCAFIGNSFADDLMMFDIVKGADFFAKVGLDVSDALTETLENGTVPVIDELNSEKQYERIFMIFGINELGWQSTEIFAQKYGELIAKAKEYQPTSRIYLMSVLPVSQAVSDKDIESINNTRIALYNGIIKNLATEMGVYYADAAAAVAGEDGALPADAASDGIHFGRDYYEKILIYIQTTLPE